MKEYLMTLSGVMILSTLISTVCAEGNLKKYVRLLCSLCLLCALISPLFRLLSEGEFDPVTLWEDAVEGEESDYDDIYHQALIENQVSYAEKLMKKQLSEEFELGEGTFDVRMETVSENGTAHVECVTLVLRDSAIFADPTKLAEYINETQKCECIVIYD